MRARSLAIVLEGLHPYRDPSAALEQYPTPPDIAAALVGWMADEGDLAGKRVADLGCGNGILGIACLLAGAAHVDMLDIDSGCTDTALENLEMHDLVDRATLHTSDVRDAPAIISGIDVVVQNPPFGSQKRGADRPFLISASRLADVVYSFHLTRTLDFVEGFASRLGMEVLSGRELDMRIKGTFWFHEKKVGHIPVTVLRMRRRQAPGHGERVLTHP